METKYVRVPFEVELAKKITEKSVEGKIVTKKCDNVRIVCFNVKGKAPILGLIDKEDREGFQCYDERGKVPAYEYNELDLMLEIPEYMTFKDGDILICECGTPFIYKDVKGRHGNFSAYCGIDLQGNIFFDMKGWTYSIKGHANEEQKKNIIEALKESNDTRAKELLERFFPNHSNSSNTGKKCEFEPKDWILCRSGKNEWTLCQFSHIHKRTNQCVSVNGLFWDIFIPYNEQTAHLLGTTKSPD